MERFETKYPELPFKELVQLKQAGTPKACMLEFENISVMDYDVSMGMLLFMLIEGFYEPLKVLVKSHNPTTLKDAMSLTRDLQNVLPRTRFLGQA